MTRAFGIIGFGFLTGHSERFNGIETETVFVIVFIQQARDVRERLFRQKGRLNLLALLLNQVYSAISLILAWVIHLIAVLFTWSACRLHIVLVFTDWQCEDLVAEAAGTRFILMFIGLSENVFESRATCSLGLPVPLHGSSLE